MNPAVISVLTNGLTCGETTACEGGTTMTAGLFTLWVAPIAPPAPTALTGAGGGHAFPNALGGHAKPTQPTVNYPKSDPDLIYIDPLKVMGRRVPVTVTFKMGDRVTEKIYTVPVGKAEVLIKVMNWITSYKRRAMSVSLSNFTKRTMDISVSSVTKKTRTLKITNIGKKMLPVKLMNFNRTVATMHITNFRRNYGLRAIYKKGNAYINKRRGSDE